MMTSSIYVGYEIAGTDHYDEYNSPPMIAFTNIKDAYGWLAGDADKRNVVNIQLIHGESNQT